MAYFYDCKCESLCALTYMHMYMCVELYMYVCMYWNMSLVKTFKIFYAFDIKAK